jgi:hypothetical protein
MQLETEAAGAAASERCEIGSGWGAAGAALDGGCWTNIILRSLARAARAEAAGAARVSCCGSSVRRKMLEQRELEAAEAARDGGCGCSLRAAGGCRSSARWRLWMQLETEANRREQRELKVAGAASDGCCGSSSSQVLREQRRETEGC